MSATPRLAVFVSGPRRFAPLVIQRIRDVAAHLRPEFFVHLWLEDLGGKARTGYDFDDAAILRHTDVRCLLHHRPYGLDTYLEKPGAKTRSGSPIFATMGMFLAINQLCHLLETLPTAGQYTHVLRIRTDCAILDETMLRGCDLASDTVWVSHNPGIPAGWISDHLFLAKRDAFMKVWRFSRMEEIYSAYQKGWRNPEKTLARLVRRKLGRSTAVKKQFLRHRDYHIVYTWPKPDEPAWVNEAVAQKRYADCFLAPYTLPLYPPESLPDAAPPPDHLGGWKYFKYRARLLLGWERHYARRAPPPGPG